MTGPEYDESPKAEDGLAAWPGTRIFGYAARLQRLAWKLRRLLTGKGPRGGLDLPRDGALLDPDRVVSVWGWVISERDAVARVEIRVDGEVIGNARLGTRRPDVAVTMPEAERHISGFEALLELDEHFRGREAELSATAVTIGDRREELGSATISIPPPSETADSATAPVFTVTPSRSHRRTSGDAIRLLVFTHDLNLGGGQLYLLDLLQGLSRAGIGGVVLAPGSGPLREPIEALGFEVIAVGAHPLADVHAYEGRQRLLLDWAERRDFDAVLANTLVTFPGVDLAARLGLPAVWAIHESWTLQTFWREAFGRLNAVDAGVRAHAQRALHSASAVVFEASATRDLFVRHGDPDRFLTIPYGIDLEAMDAQAAAVTPEDARRRLGIDTRSTLLLCLGTIEPRKAQGALARAFAVVAPDHPDARLAFVGGLPNPNTTALESYVSAADLGRQVDVMPITPNTFDWYRAADALVIASDVESLPRTALEAMALGVPVIATRTFGLPELIDDGATGFLCEPRDVGAMAAALDRFLTMAPAERQRVGAAGAELVHRRHGLTAWTSAFARILGELIDDPSAPR